MNEIITLHIIAAVRIAYRGLAIMNEIITLHIIAAVRIAYRGIGHHE